MGVCPQHSHGRVPTTLPWACAHNTPMGVCPQHSHGRVPTTIPWACAHNSPMGVCPQLSHGRVPTTIPLAYAHNTAIGVCPQHSHRRMPTTLPLAWIHNTPIGEYPQHSHGRMPTTLPLACIHNTPIGVCTQLACSLLRSQSIPDRWRVSISNCIPLFSCKPLYWTGCYNDSNVIFINWHLCSRRFVIHIHYIYIYRSIITVSTYNFLYLFNNFLWFTSSMPLVPSGSCYCLTLTYLNCSLSRRLINILIIIIKIVYFGTISDHCAFPTFSLRLLIS